jgi:hypothetical protein
MALVGSCGRLRWFVAGRLARFKQPKSIEFTSEPLRD